MNAVAGNLFHLADAAGICFFTIGLFHRLRDWMIGVILAKCYQFQEFFLAALYRRHIGYFKLTGGQSSGLIKDSSIQTAHGLQIIAAFYENALSGCRTQSAKKA